MPDALLLALGAVILLTRDVGDAAALPGAVAAGGIVALMALFVLTVAETDEAFANAYSGAVSLQNLFPRAPQRLLIVATTTVGTIGCARTRADELPVVPLPARLVLRAPLRRPARGLAARRSHVRRDDVFGAPAWRPGLIGAWVVGFAVVPVALADRPGVVGHAGAAARPTVVGDRCDTAELRRGLPRRSRRGRGVSPPLHLARDRAADTGLSLVLTDPNRNRAGCRRNRRPGSVASTSTVS